MENYLKEYYEIVLHLRSQEEADFCFGLLFSACINALELDYNNETLIISKIKKYENPKYIEVKLQKINKED